MSSTVLLGPAAGPNQTKTELTLPDTPAARDLHGSRCAEPPSLASGSSGVADTALWAWIEVLGLALIFFLYAGSPTPSVNEVHYLAKAKAYWNPNWCPGDLFLSSGDAHALFFTLFGWLTRWLTLDQTAWLGRLGGWVLLAWTWQRLSWTCVPQRGAAWVTGGLFLSGLHHAHLAGEWVVGGIEAKVIAYALVFVGLRCVLRGAWPWGWVWFGAAAAFHVLVGGWAVVVAACAYACDPAARARWQAQVPGLIVGGLVSLAGVWPALQVSHGATAAEIAEGQRIYVYERLTHHLVFHTFAAWRMQRHAILLVVLALVSWWTRRDSIAIRLSHFAWGTVALGVAGVIIDAIGRVQPVWAASLLRFYWFRLEDVLVPLAVALLVARQLDRWAPRAPATWLRTSWTGLSILAVVSLSIPYAERHQRFWPTADIQSELRRSQNPERARLDWLEACHWVRDHTPSTTLLLTPLHLQTFKWYAERAEWVNWKHVPQDPQSLLEWQRRRDWLSHLWQPGVDAGPELQRLRSTAGIELGVVSISLLPEQPSLVPLYRNGTYAVVTWAPLVTLPTHEPVTSAPSSQPESP